MHLVNSVGIFALSGDAKVDALITPFMKGEMGALGIYCDIYLHLFDEHAGLIFFPKGT